MNIVNLEGEIWKWIPNTNNMYKISNYGRVYGIYRNRLLKLGNRSYVELSINSNPYIIIIPRIINELFHKNENFSKWQPVKDLPNEEWRSIKGYEDYYSVSNLGRVKSLSKEIFHYNSKNKVKFQMEMILKPSLEKTGYFRVNLWNNSKISHQNVHRLVAEAFIPNPENKPCVNHKNGVKTNNFATNLEWCTYSENTIHAHVNGLVKINRGEDAPGVKISKEKAIQIKQELKNKGSRSIQKIADICNVSKSIVKDIHANKSWKHIIV